MWLDGSQVCLNLEKSQEWKDKEEEGGGEKLGSLAKDKDLIHVELECMKTVKGSVGRKPDRV